MGNTKSTPTDKTVKYIKNNRRYLYQEFVDLKDRYPNGSYRSQMSLWPYIAASERDTALELDKITQAAMITFNLSVRAQFEMLYVDKTNRPYLCTNDDCQTSYCSNCHETKVRPVLRIVVPAYKSE